MKTEKAWVLRNKKYYFVIPKCPKRVAIICADLARRLHGNKLAYAQLHVREVSRLDALVAGTLQRRTL